ncbi:hypothetical protein J5N58_12140, partial [Rhizobium cremeum]|uniref:hypothetical protein n=1 Tax=Rhizobium cremeum TaxID=2813827 RepID=UPI001FD5758E
MTKKNATQRVEKRRTKKSSTRRKLRNASLQQKPQASELLNVERLIEPVTCHCEFPPELIRV